MYGNIKKETKPDGAIYTYEYDVMKRLTKVYFQNDSSSTIQLLEEYSYSILTGGNTQKVYTKYLNSTDKAVTTYTYDYAGRLISQVNPDGGTITTKYNSNGTICSTTDANGGTVYFKYDGLNRLTDQWNQVESIMYSYKGYVYGREGNKIEERTGKDKVESGSTPVSDRLIKTFNQYYKNGKLKMTTDSAGRKTVYQYDKDGFLSEEDQYTSDKTLNVTEYTNNQFGKPVEMRVYVKKGNISGNDFDNEDMDVLITSYKYDKNGNLLSTKTPNNVTTEFTYDKMNMQTKVSQPGQDENGLPILSIDTTTTYNWEGKPATVTDAKGNVTEYIYNKKGFVERVKKTVSDEQGNKANVYNAYEYDLGGRKITEVTPNNFNEGSGVALSQMNRTEYTYDLMDRVKTEVKKYKLEGNTDFTVFISTAYNYDYNGNIIKVLDGEGFAAGTGTTDDDKIKTGYGTEYAFNYANQMVYKLDPVSKDRNLTYTVKYDYDGAGRKISETDARGAITTSYYDDAGNITSVTIKKSIGDIEEILKSMTYDLLGNVLTKTDGNGNITRYEYNEFNKIRKATAPSDDTILEYTVTYQYDVMSNLKNQQDSMGTVNLYEYDNQGRQMSHTEQNADGKESIKTSARYDANDNVVYSTDENGVTAKNTYDEMNRLVKTEITSKDLEGKSTNHSTTYVYDKNGNKTKTIDWAGNDTESIYDPLNRIIEKKDQNDVSIEKLEYNKSHVQVKSTDALGHDTIFSYDKNNRLLSTRDQLGHVKGQEYDDSGNTSVKYDGNNNRTVYEYDYMNRLKSVTNPLNEKTSYTYDLNNNMLSQTDGEGNTSYFEYNADNKLKRKIDQGGRRGTPGSFVYVDSKVESYIYYPDGNMKTKLDRNSNTTAYVYDTHGRMLSMEVKDDKVSYTYDNNGNLLTSTNKAGTTARTYDELNRVVIKSVSNMGTSIYQYDIIRSDIEEGFTSEISKDTKGNRTITIFDRVGRIKEVSSDGQSYTVYEYDNKGRKLSVEYPNGSKEAYKYYDNDLLNTLTNMKADGSTYDSYSYTYDNANNQTSKTDPKGTTNFVYDKLNRLQKVTEPDGKITEYNFDRAGNRSVEVVTLKDGTVTATSYTYNEQGRLLSTESKVNNENRITKYTYDNNGNLVNKYGEIFKKIDPANPPKPHFGMFIPGQTEGGATEYAKGLENLLGVYQYDGFNQLVKADGAGQSTSYTYDADGLRIEKTSNGNTTRYLYEGDKVVLETDGKGVQTARNIYGTNLVSRIISGQTGYYFYNGHGDVTSIINGSGNVLASYYYDAFGNPVETTNNMNNPYRYAGYQYDTETGLYYLKSRYYDSVTARFLSEDTYRGNVNDPLSLNLYTYCNNNPIMYVDPDGDRALDNEGKSLADYMVEEANKKAITEAKARAEAEANRAEEERQYVLKAKAEAARIASEAAAKAAAERAAAAREEAERQYQLQQKVEAQKQNALRLQAEQAQREKEAREAAAERKRERDEERSSQVQQQKNTSDVSPVTKSINSFKEIGCDIINGSLVRADNALNSPYDFTNYMTVGVLNGAVSGSVERANKAFNSLYDLGNWLSLGTFDMIKGTFSPDEPFSKEHWLNSLGTAVLTVSVAKPVLKNGINMKSMTAEGAGNGAKTTLDYLKSVEKINESYYAPKNIIDDIGKIEAKGVDFSKLNSSVMSSRASTEGGLSKVIRYSDVSGTRFIIHEVTDSAGNLLHRDFDAVRIQSGQLINKLSK